MPRGKRAMRRTATTPVAVLVAIAIGSGAAWMTKARARAEEDRVDCHPDEGVSQERCVDERNCVYEESATEGVPWCYYPDTFGYAMAGDVEDTERGFRVELARNGETNFVPDHFDEVVLEAEFHTEDRLRIKISPKGLQRYEVPLSIRRPDTAANGTKYDILVSESAAGVFSFSVVRKSTGAVIFDTSLGGMSLSDQLLQIGFR